METYYLYIILLIYIISIFWHERIFYRLYPHILTPHVYNSQVVNHANKDRSNKLIIFSINGAYSNTLVDNAKFCNRIFPKWKIRVYAPIHIDKILYRVLLLHNCQVCIVYQKKYYSNDYMYWNLFPMGESCTCIVRNPTKLLQPNDYELVRHWVKKTKIPFMRYFTPSIYGKSNLNMYSIAYRNQKSVLDKINNLKYRYTMNSFQSCINNLIWNQVTKTGVLTMIYTKYQYIWDLNSDYDYNGKLSTMIVHDKY